MIIRTVILILASLFATGVFAAGQGKGAGAGGGPQYRNLDINGDGYLSKQEVQAHQRRMETITNNWQKADRNNDGRVDISEFSAFEEMQVRQEQQQEMQMRQEQEQKKGN